MEVLNRNKPHGSFSRKCRIDWITNFKGIDAILLTATLSLDRISCAVKFYDHVSLSRRERMTGYAKSMGKKSRAIKMEFMFFINRQTALWIS